jgi:hypothetical protein
MLWTTDFLIKASQTLARLRDKHTANAAFGQAVRAAGLAGMNQRDRAALIRIAGWPEDQVREVHAKAAHTTPQHFLHNYLKRNPVVGKTAAVGKTEGAR